MNKIINEAHNEEFFEKVQPHLPVRELENCSVHKPAYSVLTKTSSAENGFYSVPFNCGRILSNSFQLQ